MAARIEWQVQRNVMMEILRVEMEESLLACLASDVLLTYFSSFSSFDIHFY